MIVIFELLEMVGMVIGFLTKNTNLMVFAGFVMIYLAIKNLEE